MNDAGSVQIQPVCILYYGDVPEPHEFRTLTRLGQSAGFTPRARAQTISTTPAGWNLGLSPVWDGLQTA